MANLTDERFDDVNPTEVTADHEHADIVPGQFRYSLLAQTFGYPSLHDMSRNMTFGRRRQTLMINDRAVSALHFAIDLDGDDNSVMYITDHSTNGTYLNRTRLTRGSRTRLNDRDLVSFANIRTESVVYQIVVRRT